MVTSDHPRVYDWLMGFISFGNFIVIGINCGTTKSWLVYKILPKMSGAAFKG